MAQAHTPKRKGAQMPVGLILEKAPPLADFYEPFIREVIASCRRVAGLDLIQQENLQRDCLGKSVFYGKFALLTHRGGADAILNYGNDYVLKLWGTTWGGIHNDAFEVDGAGGGTRDAGRVYGNRQV
jgi:hypothetical protein